MSDPIKLVSVNFDHNGKWTSVFAQGSAVELSEFLAKNGNRLVLQVDSQPDTGQAVAIATLAELKEAVGSLKYLMPHTPALTYAKQVYATKKRILDLMERLEPVAVRQQPRQPTDETQRKARLWDLMWKLRACGRVFVQVYLSDGRAVYLSGDADVAATEIERLADEVKP